MKKYVFYDVDSYTQESADWAGEDYIKLIKLCCKKCKTVSFMIKKPKNIVALALEKFRIEKPENIAFLFSVSYSNDELGIRYYKVCPELCDLLINSAQSIFEWLNGWGYENPEDPTFYRDDGSVFFYSIIHEGEIYLYPNENEDVKDIISKEWIELESRDIGDG